MRISDWSSDVCSSDLLGPAGTFTEQAARSLAPKLVPSIAPAQATGDQAPSVALEPCSTVTVALDLVRSGEVAGAVVPIENSVEGSVPVTLDELATGDPLVIAAEARSEEHTSELQSLMRISYAVFCLKKKKINIVNSDT